MITVRRGSAALLPAARMYSQPMARVPPDCERVVSRTTSHWRDMLSGHGYFKNPGTWTWCSGALSRYFLRVHLCTQIGVPEFQAGGPSNVSPSVSCVPSRSHSLPLAFQWLVRPIPPRVHDKVDPPDWIPIGSIGNAKNLLLLQFTFLASHWNLEGSLMDILQGPRKQCCVGGGRLAESNVLPKWGCLSSDCSRPVPGGRFSRAGPPAVRCRCLICGWPRTVCSSDNSI